MIEKQYYSCARCGICSHYIKVRIERPNGKNKPVIEYKQECEFYGNVNPNVLCCDNDFELNKEEKKELEIRNGLLIVEEPLGLKPLDFHADIMNIFEPIVIDNPTEREEYMKKKIIEALDNLPKKKTGYLVRELK